MTLDSAAAEDDAKRELRETASFLSSETSSRDRESNHARPTSTALNQAGVVPASGRSWRGGKYFPLTMILEPLEACNLTCTGCGRIREYEPILDHRLSVAQCLAAVEECDPPVVSIAGGEPLDAPADRRDRLGDHRPAAIRLSLHERAAVQERAQGDQAFAVLLFRRSSGWPARDARHRRRAEGSVRRCDQGDPGVPRGRISRVHEHDAVQRQRAGGVPPAVRDAARHGTSRG